MKKIIVIATHPDDETLGCGGTLLKHRASGDEINWIIITGLSESLGYSAKEIRIRQDEIKSVADKYQFNNVIQLNYITTQLNEKIIGELISKLSEVFSDLKPEVVYLPFNNDVHTDHNIAFKAAYACTKHFRCPYIKKICMMETISETDFAPATMANAFMPNYFVDISQFFKKKIEIIKLYKSELGKHPFPRSTKNIEALAVLRGSQVGCYFAESFVLLKDVW